MSSSRASPMLSLQAIEKYYSVGGHSRQVVGPISCTIHHRETVALIGPSGCGKSTLLNIIGGIIAAERGTIAWHDSKRHIGYLQQEDALLPWLSALDNAALPLRLQNVVRPTARQRAAELLAHLGLPHLHNHWPAQLSGGMRQRVALARALVDHPQLLLLDEPFRSLDGITRRKSYDWFLKIRKEMQFAVLMVTHDPDEALILANRIYVITDQPAKIRTILDVDSSFGSNSGNTECRQSANQLREALYKALRMDQTATHGPEKREIDLAV